MGLLGIPGLDQIEAIGKKVVDFINFSKTAMLQIGENQKKLHKDMIECNGLLNDQLVDLTKQLAEMNMRIGRLEEKN